MMYRIEKVFFIFAAAITMLLSQSSPAVSADGMVSADSIRTAVVDTLNAYALREGLKIEVSVPVVSNVLVKEVEHPRIVADVTKLTVGKPTARVTVDLTDPDGIVVRSIPVLAHIRTYAIAAIAVSDIQRGDKLTSLTVTFQETDVTGYIGLPVETVDLGSMQAKRTIKAGAVLCDANVETVPLIMRGDKVVMKVLVGNVMLTAKGIAREDGGMNEIIRVYNETTKKTLECRVLDMKTVVVGG